MTFDSFWLALRAAFVAVTKPADGLTQHQLDRAHCNPGTKLPAGLTGVKDAER
jgi:hypothetical protein